MFREMVSRGSTPLNDQIANDFFKINGDLISGDDSFVVVLRALLAPRMREGDSIKFSFTFSTYTKESMESHPINELIDPGQIRGNTVRLHAFSRTSSPEDNLAYMEAADDLFSKAKGWEKLTRPTEYFARSMKVFVYVNTKKKSVAILLDSVDLRKIHLLEAGMLSFFPWYFDPSKGFTADEKELCESLTKTDSSGFFAAVTSIADAMDFRLKAQIAALNELESKFDKETLETTRSKIDNIRDQIERIHRQASELLKNKYDLEIQALGLESKIGGGSSGELGEYFMSNKSLKFISADDGIKFAASGYMTYWDEDMAKSVIGNLSSSLYYGIPSTSAFSKEELQEFYMAIFVHRTIKWRTCAAFNLRPGTRQIDRPHPYLFGREFDTYMPNTHIDRYGCIGTYENTIEEAIESHDYITVLEQSVAATVSYNFADGTVARAFSQALCGVGEYTPNRKGFELPDGTITDPVGAIKWLKEHKEG